VGTPDVWDRINVQGTRRMLGAAQQAGGGRRSIHIGTEGALVRGQHLRGVDETAPLAFDSPYPYCRTKALAEQADDNCAALSTIVLRPRSFGVRVPDHPAASQENGRKRLVDVDRTMAGGDLHNAHRESG
jgi:nucleoside-diphosphate-sugar epimerase